MLFLSLGPASQQCFCFIAGAINVTSDHYSRSRRQRLVCPLNQFVSYSELGCYTIFYHQDHQCHFQLATVTFTTYYRSLLPHSLLVLSCVLNSWPRELGEASET
ncbi:hypothetical protein BDW74DRAFT_61114 [Aspergillus multicolor]|uniref:uncharacterized protein n=1 Tax=Aspergillus multicolor TaxID=41759 RepID=UPI003CCD72FF